MARVYIRPQAGSDIDEIWDYIAESSLAHADGWVDRLNETFNSLATQPMMGRARGELSAGLRSFPCARYLIFYLPVTDGIDVVRVLHSARDVPAIFDESPRD